MKKIRLSYFVYALFLVACFLVSVLGLCIGQVYAENEIAYSDVLADLQKDVSFNIDDYPFIGDDYSLQVIQIAESVNGELFVYVYQPSADSKNLLARSINISTEIRNKLSYKNYDLALINSNGVFYKFVVEDFHVLDDDVRYYDISNILRNWNEEIDEDSGYDNSVSEKGFEVGKLYSVSGFGDDITYLVKDTDVVEIVDKFVGYVRYPDGFHLFLDTKTSCDSHFVAFSTDKDIDKLYEAQVYFTQQSYSYMLVTYPFIDSYEMFGKPEKTYVDLDYTQKGSWESSGWGSHKYTWTRISNVETFFQETNKSYIFNAGILDVKDEVKIDKKAEEKIKEQQWVLRFVETPYEYTNNGNIVEKRTKIGDVSILRLKFEKDGIVYNLGVVDNKQTGSDDPVNTVERTVHIAQWVKTMIAVILSVAGAVLLGLLINFLFPGFWPAIGAFSAVLIVKLCKGLWWIITSPFSLFFGD